MQHPLPGQGVHLPCIAEVHVGNAGAANGQRFGNLLQSLPDGRWHDLASIGFNFGKVVDPLAGNCFCASVPAVEVQVVAPGQQRGCHAQFVGAEAGVIEALPVIALGQAGAVRGCALRCTWPHGEQAQLAFEDVQQTLWPDCQGA